MIDIALPSTAAQTHSFFMLECQNFCSAMTNKTQLAVLIRCVVVPTSHLLPVILVVGGT